MAAAWWCWGSWAVLAGQVRGNVEELPPDVGGQGQCKMHSAACAGMGSCSIHPSSLPALQLHPEAWVWIISVISWRVCGYKIVLLSEMLKSVTGIQLPMGACMSEYSSTPNLGCIWKTVCLSKVPSEVRSNLSEIQGAKSASSSAVRVFPVCTWHQAPWHGDWLPQVLSGICAQFQWNPTAAPS